MASSNSSIQIFSRVAPLKLHFTVSNHIGQLGRVSLCYVDVMKIEYLSRLVRWCGHIKDEYDLNFGEVGGKSIVPFEKVVSFATHLDDYKLPTGYKLIFECLCLANFMTELGYQQLVANTLKIEESDLSVNLHPHRDVLRRIRERLQLSTRRSSTWK